MMLPMADGMIVTYAQIADTASRKREPAVSPLVLIAGYVSVWLSFALLAAVLQAALARAALLDSAMASTSPLFSGALFIGAGAYQFTALKHACISRCQRPFPFFFGSRAGVFASACARGSIASAAAGPPCWRCLRSAS